MGLELIFGAVVAGLVQVIKKFVGTRTWATLAIVALVSLAAAGVYTWLKANGYWEAFVEILIVAGAVHNYILRRFE